MERSINICSGHNLSSFRAKLRPEPATGRHPDSLPTAGSWPQKTGLTLKEQIAAATLRAEQAAAKLGSVCLAEEMEELSTHEVPPEPVLD